MILLTKFGLPARKPEQSNDEMQLKPHFRARASAVMWSPACTCPLFTYRKVQRKQTTTKSSIKTRHESFYNPSASMRFRLPGVVTSRTERQRLLIGHAVRQSGNRTNQAHRAVICIRKWREIITDQTFVLVSFLIVWFGFFTTGTW